MKNGPGRDDVFDVPLPMAAMEITQRSGAPCSWAQAWQAVLAGHLLARKAGGRWMCSRQSMEAFIRARTKRETAQSVAAAVPA